MTSLTTPPKAKESTTNHQQTTTFPQQSKQSFQPIKTGLWLLFWLIIADVAINLLFPFPRSIQQTPNSLERYFDYGRSIEGKLKRMVSQPTPSNQNILAAGWIESESWQSLPTTTQAGDDLLVSVYGMSFSDNIASYLTELDNKITLRSLGAPAAPASHSLATFTADTPGKNADVAVIGVLASSIKRIHSVSGSNWSYENPTPYTYPYYSLNEQNQLTTIEPAIKTADQFRQAITEQNEDWEKLQQQMREYDSPFSSFVFDSNISDRSALIRLIRRGWANRTISQTGSRLHHPQKGFNLQSSEIRTLKAILTEFTNQANSAQQKPVIILISDRGYVDHLYEALANHLNTLDVAVLNTHEIVPADDPTNFIPDGHFTPENDRKLAQALQEIIRRETSKP